MDFRKKIKIRMYVGLAEFLFAAALIAICAYGTNAQIGMFGTMLAVIALKNIRKNLAYLKNDGKLRKEEIIENDERNISIVNRARSLSFIIFVVILSVLGTVLYALDKADIAALVFEGLCALVIIYWICYIAISRKY